MTRIGATSVPAALLGTHQALAGMDFASSSDPVQRATFESQDRLELRISGTATNAGAKPSRLELRFAGQQVSVSLSGGMTPAATLRKLQESMPKGWQAVLLRTWRHPGADVIVGIRRPPPVAQASTGLQANDPMQLVVSLGKGRFQIAGVASNNGVVQSSVVIEAGGRTKRVMLVGGETPLATAERVRKALASLGCRASWSVPRQADGPVTLTILQK